MTKGIRHFLIVFDHAVGELRELQEFGEDSEQAVHAYAEKERELQGEKTVEIVLIGSDSLETVKLTHANYFEEAAAGSKYLAGLR
ncbi:MAG TPA: hypothetical protein DEV93_15950 [Chloroflexi bacterium]|jgi:hypothetical protein|nr:hypothetical protein [Chloroflexota bacterium]